MLDLKRARLFYLPCLVAFIACAQNRQQVAIVDHNQNTGVLDIRSWWTNPQCGGALLEEDDRRSADPWKGPHYIRNAMPQNGQAFNDLKLDIVDSLFTNEDGIGTLELSPGNYIVIDRDLMNDDHYERILREFGKGSQYYSPVETTCLHMWLRGPFDVVQLSTGDTTYFTRSIAGRCSWDRVPCSDHSGPLPP